MVGYGSSSRVGPRIWGASARDCCDEKEPSSTVRETRPPALKGWLQLETMECKTQIARCYIPTSARLRTKRETSKDNMPVRQAQRLPKAFVYATGIPGTKSRRLRMKVQLSRMHRKLATGIRSILSWLEATAFQTPHCMNPPVSFFPVPPTVSRSTLIVGMPTPTGTA